MATLEMCGPFELTIEAVDENVREHSIGNYALGYRSKKNGKSRFIVEYVGRSDTDIANRLKQHIDEGYKCFKYSYETSPKKAFEKECKNYHDFGENIKLHNKVHPDRPDGSTWKCPYCNNFD